MAHRVTAVVYDQRLAKEMGEELYLPDVFMFEVAQWYEALDMITIEWAKRYPSMSRTYGVDDLEIRSITIMKLPDEG